jgi:hypothetical protein
MIRRLLLNTHIGTMLLLTVASSSRGAFAADFTVVPPSDPAYSHLQTIRTAPWAGSWSGTSAATSLTRYELALETAKSLISLRARHNADANWGHTLSPDSIRALRQLCVSFKSELPQFNVDVPATLQLLDGLLTQTTVVAPAPAVAAPTPAATVALPQLEAESDKTPSLSQRLRVYSALDSLARQANDPFKVTNTTGVQRLRIGASYDLNNSIRLSGEMEKEDRQRPAGLRDFLAGTSLDASAQSARELEANAIWTLRPGITLSSGVAHIDSDNPLNDGLRFESSLGLTGWQNRIALSAHLSRLVPEDSQALGQTAARLNLGVGLTSQIQLKLMYQQLFGATAAGQTNRRVGGGIDFSF